MATASGRTWTWRGNPNSHHFDYVYDVDGALPAVLVDGNSNGSLRYVWGPAGLAYAVDTSNGVTVYHADGLGSVRAITDGSGTVVETYRSDAYGLPTCTQGGINQHFQYTGQERDEDGLVFLRGRVYNPTLGRFMQRDPLAGNPGLPLSLNRYTYAGNNPTTKTDPSGRSSSRDLGYGFHFGLYGGGAGALPGTCVGAAIAACLLDPVCLAPAAASVLGVGAILHISAHASDK